MVKNVVTKDFDFAFANPLASGQVDLILPLSETKSKALSDEVLTETAKFMLTGYTVSGTIEQGAVASAFTFTPSAVYCKAEGKKVLLHEDTAEVSITGVNPSGSAVTVSDTVIIKAKQSKVKGC